MDVWVDAKWKNRGIDGHLLLFQKRPHSMEMTSHIFTRVNPLEDRNQKYRALMQGKFYCPLPTMYSE